MSAYSGLRRAQLSLDYLHANSTTHEFLFGALAEMVDNARDAQATQLEIFDLPNPSLRGGFALCFLDDGEGMAPEEAARVVTFGYSEKRAKADNLIGMYGNGLKSGSMRIGNDLIVFTKKNSFLSILFLSRTFHETEHLIEVIVPVPSFDGTTRKPIDDGDPEMHKQEIDIILKYSPFKTMAELMTQFDRITSESGTLIIIYNLKLLDTGEPELQFTKGDIVLANPPGHEFDSDEVLHEEQKSFAAYCAILYMDPRMKIYVQGVKVRTRKLLADLYKPRMYKYSSSRFKTRSEGEMKKAEADASKYDYLAREAESKARDLQKRCAAQLTNLKLRQECRRADEEASRLRQQAQLYKQLAERKKRELKDPKTLTLYFGLQVNYRGRDGAFVYNCSRLIAMFHRLHEGVPRGLVAVVDVPYLVLEPTHNKQDFADAKEFRHLMRALSEHALSYCRDLGLENQANIDKFWTDFGYVNTTEWSVAPSDEPKFVRKRRAEVPTVIQCDSCLKWRVLPFSVNPPAQYPPDWHCAQNPDPTCNRCGAPEQRQSIPEVAFRRPVVNQAEAAEKLQDEIRRKQAQLAKMQPVQSPVKAAPPPPPPAPLAKAEKASVEEEPAKAQSSSKEEPPPTVKSPAKASVADAPPAAEGGSPARLLRPRRVTAPEQVADNAQNGNDKVNDDENAAEPAKRRKVSEEAPPVLRGRLAIRSAGRPIRGKPPEPSEEEEEEEEEEEKESSEEEPPPKRPAVRGAPAKSPVKRNVRGAQAQPVEESSEEEEEEEEDDEEESSEDDEPVSKQGAARGAKATQSSPPSKKQPSVGNLSQNSVAQLVENYRSCLRYFLPPGWKKFDKDTVSSLSAGKLVTFPQQEFFDEYEQGLKSLVGKLRDENLAARKQLGNVRRMVASLLERILDKPAGTLLSGVSDHPDNHEIDDLLKTCLDKTNNSSDSSSNSNKKTGSASASSSSKSLAKKGSTSSSK